MGNSDLTEPIGYCTSVVSIGENYDVICFMVLLHCVTDVILDWDFLGTHEASNDCANNDLHFSNIDVPDINPAQFPAIFSLMNHLVVPPKAAVRALLTVDPLLHQPYGVI